MDSRPEGSAARRRTVYVVDDEEMVRTVAAELLRHLGYDVEMASSGEEAVAHIQQGARPDCVLLDVVMPGMGGAEALRRIRAIAPEIRVVISSGFTDTVSSTSLTDEGAAGIITKPYRMEALGKRLKELLA
ncbi:MAG TPA: response regulator [Candidatus Binatia bacterium]|nr:response regulator [Candidatus Binatia bacterium]